MVFTLTSIVFTAIINSVAVVIYGLSGFGNGVIFHMGFQICNRILPAVCDGSVATADTYIAIAGLVIFPAQVYLLWKSIHWKLGIVLIIFQQAGLFAGTYIAYTVKSYWLPRLLGVLMCSLAYQRFLGVFCKYEPDDSKSERANVLDLTTTQDWLILLLVGVTSGMFGGLFVTGGPPLMYFAHYINLDKDICRATIALTYLAENIERVVILYFLRPPSVDMDITSLELIVVLVCSTSIVALLIGNAISASIDQQKFQWIILWMLIFGSFLLMTTGCGLLITGVIVAALFVVYGASFLCLFRAEVCDRIITIVPKSQEYEAVEMHENDKDDDVVSGKDAIAFVEVSSKCEGGFYDASSSSV